MPRPYPVRFYHHGSRPGRIYSGDPGKAWDAAIIHGAAIGRINDEQLLKLRTLSMTEAEAENVIIEKLPELKKKETREQKRGISSLHRWRFLFLCIFTKSR